MTETDIVRQLRGTIAVLEAKLRIAVEALEVIHRHWEATPHTLDDYGSGYEDGLELAADCSRAALAQIKEVNNGA